MFKELFAVTVLVLLFIAVLLNVSYITNLTESLQTLVEDSRDYALSGEWELSLQKAYEAERRWQKADTYTHIVIRHEEIETAYAAFYNLIGEIYKQDIGGVQGASLLLIDQLGNISSMERLTMGTVF